MLEPINVDLKSDNYDVLIFVRADTSHLAREAAVRLLTAKTIAFEPGIRNFELAYLEPIRAKSTEASELINQVWQTYIEKMKADLKIIVNSLSREVQNGIATETLWDDWSFRTACLRIGVIDGWPIRIYDPVGLGVNTWDLLETPKKDDDLWVVKIFVS